jgi:protein-tyrosine kinase
MNKQSIIERLAQRMEVEGVEEYNFDPARVAPPPAPSAPRVDPEIPVAGPEPRPSTAKAPVEIDLARLRKAGMVTPAGGRQRVVDEFRIIKRPILQNVLLSETEAFDCRRNLVMVTSARPGEGKTFTAISLAMSVVAEQDTSVLLVDLDLAKQKLSHTLGLRGRPGLIDLLSDNPPPLADVLLPTNVPRLSVLPAGGDHPLANELLAGPTMRRLMRDISERYRYGLVIFDTSPALSSTDPSVLALSVGHTIMVVQAYRTSRSSVDEALSLLSGCSNIYLVLNRIEQGDLADQYGSAYGVSYGS